MRGVFAQLPMTPDAQVLVNLGLIHRDNEVISYWDGWLSWMRTQGWRRFAWYVWDQGPGMPGDWAGRLAPSFEFIFHFNRESRKPNKIVPCKHAGQESHLRPDGSSTAMRNKAGEVGGWQHAGQPTQDTRIPDSVILYGWPEGQQRHWCGDRDQGDVWQIKKPAKNDLHPTMKPVELVERCIRNSTKPGQTVLDPFGGSGTTLIAAEKSGRQARLMELDPKYVDVIVRRWQDWTGQEAILEATGEPFPPHQPA
jgi:DNA modification methylase